MDNKDCERCVHYVHGCCSLKECKAQTKAEFAREIISDTLEAVVAQSRLIGVVKPSEAISDDEWEEVRDAMNIENRLFVEKVVQSLISRVFDKE